ncbi:helicase [Caviibacterium pharyngocola]|uniref:Helicase n=2 Tax=Caviibacterium pharyngocola TaxID=28159 RepID=A0A2M8RZ13_9PAST|nr:helicase [Caviibacterium pharyngocola]
MPVVEVPQVTADTVNQSSVLNLHFLSQFKQNKSQTIQALYQFVEDYAKWITTQKSQLSELGEMSVAGQRIIQRMEIALYRMKSGIQLLANNENAAIAFSLTNQAMLNQMLQSAKNNKKNTALSQFNWRPFQLAFILTTLSSSVNQEDDFRDMFDLIWFPTGGGKTEAYLGLAAFVILFRRLTYPNSSDGTAVLMRYTLRLLTAQQFLRATRLICALEILRQENTSLLGDKPITIGLWVGQASTPNLFSEANDIVREIKQGSTQKQNAFVLQECPWCKTPFSDQNFRAKYNTLTKKGEFHFHCYSPHCHFGQSEQALPCQVVDEGLYETPPTFLVATLDKFARFPWEERATSFLGKGTNRPPELIIQDELHLIAGALGSVSGVYEAALDTILRIKGIYPKYVASTATIRMADEQVKKLYAREVSIFPSQGINAEDAYFAKTVPLSKKPGRCYIGYFAPHLSRRDSLAPLATALLRAPSALFNHLEQREELIDAWWTQVIYHGSLKGIGVSHNAFNVDISKTYQRLYEQETTGDNEKENYIEPIDRQHPNIKQLTSLLSAADNTEIFAKLELNWMKPKECIDVLLATNMISVGLDVSRLALMIINGQPLTTAEYIQASSRVGRSTVPGVVFVNYYRDQARSLSHYENFQAYHDGFYRFVEPTSVTPFTYQARKRALAAALVMVMRHSIPNLLNNSGAEQFSSVDEDIANALRQFVQRCGLADPERKSEITQHIQKLAKEWDALIQNCQNSCIYQKLVYHHSEQGQKNLLTTLESPEKGYWAILNSMRNVEHSGEIDLL